MRGKTLGHLSLSLCASLALTLGLSGCTIGEVKDPSGAEGIPSASATGSPGPDPTTSGADVGTGSSAAEGASMVARGVFDALPDGVDLSIAHDGHSSHKASVPPWSTIKVPIAIAALRQDEAAARPHIAPAIAQSSNDAAAQLWALLGDPATAAALTEKVIREGQSTATVQDQQVRAGFSSFGQSDWGLPEQAAFASHLRCIPGAEPVIAEMGRIANGGGYGLGTVPGAIFKGGWGPDESGMYGARQFGLLPNGSGGFVAVALAATSPDGSMDGAQGRLTEAVSVLRPALGSLPTAAC